MKTNLYIDEKYIGTYSSITELKDATRGLKPMVYNQERRLLNKIWRLYKAN